ncbi:HEAT repeat-containing protein [Paenibacillus macquariensis]|uniref:HEAT repeat-containing protein n=2 Tax=Paenibacillus macquariensis TaxID=948756 RepID=A0ABY1K2W6_9BACL|nr:HEAT repeat-containing protein [Paenibacillus macquariensis]
MNNEEVVVEEVMEEEVVELAPTVDDFKKAANGAANWEERVQAVVELGKLNDKQAIGILTRIMANDSVYKVQEAAFHALKECGEDVEMPQRKERELFKGVNKILLRVKKSLPVGHTFEEFKEKLKKMRVDVYNTYEGDKGADFDKWLEGIWASTPKK